MAEGGGGGGRDINFGVNSAFVENTTMTAAVKSRITYFSYNDGSEPEVLQSWGYSQSQQLANTPSIITSYVSIHPGVDAELPQVDFSFTTTLNETMEGIQKYHHFSAGDGQIIFGPNGKQLYLIPNGVPNVRIGLYPRVPGINPPVWFIETGNQYFSRNTAPPLLRFSLTINLIMSEDSDVTVKKSVQSGAQVYTYTQNKPERPFVSKDHPLFPPSRPL